MWESFSFVLRLIRDERGRERKSQPRRRAGDEWFERNLITNHTRASYSKAAVKAIMKKTRFEHDFIKMSWRMFVKKHGRESGRRWSYGEVDLNCQSSVWFCNCFNRFPTLKTKFSVILTSTCFDKLSLNFSQTTQSSFLINFLSHSFPITCPKKT